MELVRIYSGEIRNLARTLNMLDISDNQRIQGTQVSFVSDFMYGISTEDSMRSHQLGNQLADGLTSREYEIKTKT